MKRILKEGAQFNQILRIKDESFYNLVDALKIPYEFKTSAPRINVGELEEIKDFEMVEAPKKLIED